MWELKVWIEIGRRKGRKKVPDPHLQVPHLHPAKTKRKKENLQPDGENDHQFNNIQELAKVKEKKVESQLLYFIDNCFFLTFRLYCSLLSSW